MTRPTIGGEWASDAAYTNGPVAGLPNKAEPSAGERAEGFIPTQPIPADWLNWKLNNIDSWRNFLDGAVGALALGNGFDGDCVFDGVNTFAFASKVGNVYTLTRNVYARSMTFAVGCSLVMSSVASGTWVVYCQGVIDTSACGSGPVITADGPAGGTGGAGGASLTAGFLNGSGAGGGAVGADTPGAAGGNVANAYSGAGGLGGNSGAQAGGAGGTVTAPAANLGTPYVLNPRMVGWNMGAPAGFSAGAMPGGAGGGGGGRTGSGTVGTGGAGGGIMAILCRELRLANANNIRCKGGNGGNATSAGGITGGGAGGGGGLLLIVYGFSNVVLSAAVNCPGGTGGTGANGGTSGANGSNGNIIEHLLGGVTSGSSVASTVEQKGVAAFAEGGSGAGFDYVDVVLSPVMPSAGYNIKLSLGMDNDTDGAPVISYRLKTTAGFRIRTNAQFPGEVSWTATPA